MTSYGVEWSRHPAYKKDPLPEIEPALLNSEDIRRYVDAECLLDKDSFDAERMKPASYEMRFLGTLYDWKQRNGELERRRREIVEGEDVELSKNSISYLWIKERLRLPEYIAARFNLRISEVHKGILLGTGPLVDPGFGGQILIPLHNLTDNSYLLRGGEGIIWVEFTKVSKNHYWLPGQGETERPSGLMEFPSNKAIDDPDAYLKKAGAVRGVQSAFRGALDHAKDSADDSQAAAEAARKRVEDLDKRIRAIGGFGLIGVSLGIAGLVLSAYDLIGPVKDSVHRQSERIHELEKTVEDLKANSSASSAADEPEAPEPSGADVAEPTSPAGETESEGDDQLADDRRTSQEPGEPPASGVR